MPASSHRGGWRRPSALFPLAGFVVSLVVHALTYAGIDVSRGFPLVWALHVGAILAFGTMMVGGRRNRWAGGFELPDWPAWAYLLAAAALFYAFVNFMRFFSLSQGGAPEVTAGGYVLSDHGRVIRSLTEAEYWRQKAYILRGFSGHWMFFFLLPALHFALRRTDREQARTPATAA